MNWNAIRCISIMWSVCFLFGCTPSVRFEAPDKPIEINMNIKIDHQIRLRVEKDVDELISNKKGLF